MLAGCGSDPLPVQTAPLSIAQPVSAQVYLNDSAEAARATRDFAAVLGRAEGQITAAEARALAPDLRTSADRVCALSQRLSAARLDDARLESQRRGVVDSLSNGCQSMRAVATAAEAGNVRTVVAQAAQVKSALDQIRTAVRTGS